MKTFRTLLVLLLAAAMLLPLAACARGSESIGVSGKIRELASPDYSPEPPAARVDRSGLNGFAARSLPTLFADLDGENRVASPLNIYMALAMLSEVTDGESRAQLLALLGSEDPGAMRAEIRALWEASREEEDGLTVLPAASLWLRDGYAYKPEALQVLADDYYAAAFAGPMGSENYNRRLRDWINEQTRHLLEAQAAELELDPDTVIALVTTLYFKSAWASPFREDLTKDESFRTERGEKQAPFMHRTLETAYYRGEHFGAIRLSMRGGASTWLLLPDEDSSLPALIEEGEAAALLEQLHDWDRQKDCVVHLSLPKFDVAGKLSLIDALRALGVTDVFDAETADFTPLCDETLYVSRVEHAARVKIDEEGGEAAAYTVIEAEAGAAPPEEQSEEIDFVCDRPFLFAIVGGEDQLLFVGAVNDPTK